MEFPTLSKLTQHVRWLCDLLIENEVSGGPGHLCNSGFLAFQSYFILGLAFVPKIASSVLSWTFPQTCTVRLMELCTSILTTFFFCDIGHRIIRYVRSKQVGLNGIVVYLSGNVGSTDLDWRFAGFRVLCLVA